MIIDFQNLKPTDRILSLRKKTLSAIRYLSIEQAKIITRVYNQNENLPIILKRSKALLHELQNNFVGNEPLRQLCINHVPKYGNDIAWVDDFGAKWVVCFADKIKQYKNFRGWYYSNRG